MDEKLDQQALAQLTEEERQALAEDSEDEIVEHADTADAEEQRRDPAPLLDTRVPADLPQRLAALDGQKAELVQKFDDGEITAREYSEGLEAIADRRDDLSWQKRKADFAREQHEIAINGAWDRAVEKFMTTTGKNIADRGEGALLAFDSYVKRVTGDPAFARLSDRAQLAKAYRLFEADFGKLPSARSASAYDPEPGSQDDHARDVSDFARLDRLMDSDPIAYEKAIAAMTPDEADAYLRR